MECTVSWTGAAGTRSGMGFVAETGSGHGTDRALVAKWPIDRIDPVLRALFRAAGAELVTPKTPPKVVITEYVRIAQAFFAEGREAKFVNAVLDYMAHEARPEAF